jgi:pantetheine-phosphate adenylyltransferase
MAQAAAIEHGLDNIEVDRLDGLLVNYCQRHGVRVVVRGLRAYSDFEYEFQMALTNRKLAPEIETLFMMPNEEHSYVTASTVREVARYGGETGCFVPPVVQRRIEEYLRVHPEARIRKGGGVGNTGAFDR